MIKYVEGDLFQTPFKYITHGCNAQGKMGKGVAKTMRELYPKAYEEYYNLWLRNKALVPGTIQLVDCGEKTIINSITQKFYAAAYGDTQRYVSYDAISECMQAINKAIPGEYLAMPKIGAQLGGGNWAIISKIIEEELTDVYPVVYIL